MYDVVVVVGKDWKKVFGRGFKIEVCIEFDLVDWVDVFLEWVVLQVLLMMCKVGELVIGFLKVEVVLWWDLVVGLIYVLDVVDDGVWKFVVLVVGRMELVNGG